jgi:hypothetical protein
MSFFLQPDLKQLLALSPLLHTTRRTYHGQTQAQRPTNTYSRSRIRHFTSGFPIEDLSGTCKTGNLGILIAFFRSAFPIIHYDHLLRLLLAPRMLSSSRSPIALPVHPTAETSQGAPNEQAIAASTRLSVFPAPRSARYSLLTPASPLPGASRSLLVMDRSRSCRIHDEPASLLNPGTRIR